MITNIYLFLKYWENTFSNVIENQFIDIKLTIHQKLMKLRKALSNIIGGKIISSWRDRNIALVGAIQMEKIGSVVVLSLILLVASLVFYLLYI